MLIKALGNYIKNVSEKTFEVLSQNGSDNDPEPLMGIFEEDPEELGEIEIGEHQGNDENSVIIRD